MSKLMIRIFLILILALGLNVALAQENQVSAEMKKNVAIKTISGEIGGISSNFIAILYDQDKQTSYEMALTMNKDTKVERKNSLKEIRAGDIVTVQYEEATLTTKEKTIEGEDKDVVKVLGRLVKVVTFIRSPAEGLRSSEGELQE